MMSRWGDPALHRAEFLALEYRASAAYNQFVYGDREQADAVRGLLFDREVAEFAAAFSRILSEDARVMGVVSCLSDKALRKCRMRSAYTLARSGVFDRDSRLQARMSLANETLMRLEPDDFYLSRIAVAAEASGKGYALQLLRHCEDEAGKAGAARICLEVYSENAPAISFYAKNGFERVDHRSVSEPDTGRTLEYLHMAKDVDA